MGAPLSPELRVTLRAVETRLYLEEARRYLRMYLADPAQVNKTPDQVLLHVLGILENAPAPAQSKDLPREDHLGAEAQAG